MKNLLILLLTITSIGCSPKHNISVKFNGFSNDTIVISHMPYADYVKGYNSKFNHDTLILNNGRVVTSIELSEPQYIWINNMQYHNIDTFHGTSGFHPAGGVTLVMKQGDKVNIKVTQTDGYVVSDVKGTQLCSDISEVDNILRPIHKLRHETGDEINRIIAKQQVPSPEIRQNMTSYNDRIKEIKANFITSHLTDEVAAYLLLGIRLKDALALYEQMDKSLFANTFKVVEEQIIEIQNIGRIKSNAERELTVDSVAPDFTLKDASNKDFRLSSLQGKWVVIDFWGTWCGWCIKGFPKMKEIYAKYKDSLEIVAVNCIDSDERWTEAIKKHSLPWINVKNNNNVSARYAVSVYPTKIIITPEGRIHKVFTGESDDFYNEIDKIMK